jgi:hypothetical protein
VVAPLTNGKSLVDIIGMRERRPRRDKKQESRTKTLRLRLAKAQRAIRKQVPPNVSLVDELIAERREEARRESDPRR